jgi:(p)ppGpp synthase/HD superfamily hydrolase
MTTKEKINWCIHQHEKTNHFYDNKPYAFHLNMVASLADFYMPLINNEWFFDEKSNNSDTIILACWGHDLIEDTRNTYNDVKNVLGEEVAEIVYALTNEKGKNRKERANTKYYYGIRQNKAAVFVKLCDRIANVMYSKNSKSGMIIAYKKENKDFEKMLGRHTSSRVLEPMFARLDNLLS